MTVSAGVTSTAAANAARASIVRLWCSFSPGESRGDGAILSAIKRLPADCVLSSSGVCISGAQCSVYRESVYSVIEKHLRSLV